MQKTMFMPNFKYTNQIVNRLSKIAVARGDSEFAACSEMAGVTAENVAHNIY